ncbi:ABC transporter substrate-binding protein [Luteipulveratus mongoliensis]|uniref:ABC transporter substrate-binding protein n=1 Tax=Luteipulveratus mongoliensis TaxID=571913 RepID=A0A0K1JG26_9MICO|nr:ABC transporter substrate-binding protein [Luteipulveratus mongoliensis]AKU15656.1 ABC transporter substrate-binding protein [Luteipulveratus mongoliensis]
MKRAITPAVVALSTALAISACNANPSSDDSSSAGSKPEATAKGGTLTIYNSSSELSFEPAKSQSLAITSLGLVHRRLTTWDIKPGQQPKVVPDLATTTGTPSDGGKTWTFTLKDGLKFSNGQPITSADIKYGIERSFAPELSGGLGYHKALLTGAASYKGPYKGQQLPSIATPNAKTIVFHLNVPYGDWPWIASMGAFSPVPKAADTTPASYGNKPVASGPYEVENYKQGTSLTLKRNPQWSTKTDSVRLGGPDKIVYKLSQDESVAAQSLIADSGEARTAFGSGFVPPAQLKQITSNPSAKSRLALSNPGALAYLAINTKHGKLADKRVRQAITYAVDKKAFQLAVGGAQGGAPATTLITPGIPGRQAYDLYPAPETGDVTKAKGLLKSAGATNLNLKLITSNKPSDVAKAEAIQQGLKRAGITVTIKPLEEENTADAQTDDKGDYDLTVGSWQPDFPSANGNIQPLFDSSQIGGGNYNLSRYSNPAVDALIKQATGEIDPAKAGAIWAKADKLILQDAPVVPLIYTRNAFLRGSGVSNFDVSGFPNYPNYLRVSLTK